MLEFRVLGPFEVLRDGRPVELGGARRRAFLALLVLNAGRVLGTDRLIDTLWGARPPKTAGHVLHVYASELRKALHGDVLVTRPPGYVLEVAPEGIDVLRFERLLDAAHASLRAGDADAAWTATDAALALQRGAVLEDLAYEEFVQPEARRLEELLVAARELHAEAGLARGAEPQLVATLRALADEHPLRESTQALLMRALAASGRQAEALDVYAAVRTRLDEELGIEPGRALRDVQLAVLRQDVGEATTAAAPPPRTVGPVVAVAFGPARLRAVATLADAVAVGSDRDVLIACVQERSGQGADLDAAWRAALDVKAELASSARGAAFASPDVARDVVALALEHNVDLLVVDGGAEVDQRLPRVVREVLEAATADVAVLFGDAPPAETTLAAPFGGSEHDWAAVEVAALVARATSSGVRMIGVTTADDDASRLLARAALAVQRAVGIDAEAMLAEAGANALLAAVDGCGGVVVGLSDRWRSEGLGELRAGLARSSPSAVVLRRGLRPGLLAPSSARTRFSWSLQG